MSSIYIEDYIPVIKWEGLNTAKAVAFGSTLAVTGALTASGGVAGAVEPGARGQAAAEAIGPRHAVGGDVLQRSAVDRPGGVRPRRRLSRRAVATALSALRGDPAARSR